ncbi:MAG: cupredoxin domain-containing protein [Nitrososphaerota archaeon]|nr:cupredoxin domain-containing protein [Nitrososphaerota archaeon]
MSSKSSSLVGIVVAVLIIGAVASIGYYQFEVAPSQLITSTTTTSAAPSVNCQTSPSSCVNVTIVSGASAPYAGYNGPNSTLYGYDPSTVTLVIGVNNTVVFTNEDSAFHTATSASTDPAQFNSQCLNGIGAPCPAGQGAGASSFQFTFTVPGTYLYHCVYHPWMQGKIVVEQGTGTTTTTTSATSATSASTSAAGSSTSPTTAQVSIVSGASIPYSGYGSGSTQLYGYSPQNLTVVIGVNNTVTWTNLDSAFHTVTSVSGDPASFESGCLSGVGAPCSGSNIGSSFTYTFTVPGTYVYHCDYHPWMRGEVIVLPASSA